MDIQCHHEICGGGGEFLANLWATSWRRQDGINGSWNTGDYVQDFYLSSEASGSQPPVSDFAKKDNTPAPFDYSGLEEEECDEPFAFSTQDDFA
jgi:hypothetical protein